jgi:hypothetical protein
MLRVTLNHSIEPQNRDRNAVGVVFTHFGAPLYSVRMAIVVRQRHKAYILRRSIVMI